MQDPLNALVSFGTKFQLSSQLQMYDSNNESTRTN